jgi:hypothetical protein
MYKIKIGGQVIGSISVGNSNLGDTESTAPVFVSLRTTTSTTTILPTTTSTTTIPVTTTSTSTTTLPYPWILATGIWNDGGMWVDSATWID